MNPFNDLIGDRFCFPMRFPNKPVVEERELGNSFPLSLFAEDDTLKVRRSFRNKLLKLNEQKNQNLGVDGILKNDYLLEETSKRGHIFVPPFDMKNYVPPHDPVSCLFCGIKGSGKSNAKWRFVQEISVVEFRKNEFPSMLIIDPQGDLKDSPLFNKYVINTEKGHKGDFCEFEGTDHVIYNNKQYCFYDFGYMVSELVIRRGLNVIIPCLSTLNSMPDVRNIFITEVIKAFKTFLNSEYIRKKESGIDELFWRACSLLVIDEYGLLKTNLFDDVIDRYVSETRKFGGGYVFATQLPQDFPFRVRSQTDVVFLGRFKTEDAFGKVKETLFPRLVGQPIQNIFYLNLISGTCSRGVFFCIMLDKTEDPDSTYTDDFGPVKFMKFHQTNTFFKGLTPKIEPNTIVRMK